MNQPLHLYYLFSISTQGLPGFDRRPWRGIEPLTRPRLLVGAELTFDGTCQVTGGIDLSMSQLGSISVRPGCALLAPGRTALDLTNTELLSTFTVGEEVPVEGTVRLSGARIHGNLCLRGAVLSAPEGRSLLAAQGVSIDGEAELQNVRATGGDLGFRAATIGSFLDAAGAKLHNPGGYTMNLVQANVKGSVPPGRWIRVHRGGRAQPGRHRGPPHLHPGDLPPARATRARREPDAIEAISATIRSGMDLGWKSISPRADFTNTRTSFLADDPGPGHRGTSSWVSPTTGSSSPRASPGGRGTTRPAPPG